MVRQRAALLAHRAEAALAAHETGRARDLFRAALRLRPDDAQARRKLAALELGLGNWELALLELQSVVEFHPEDPESFLAVAELKLQHGWLEAPEAALDDAIELAPGRADARRMRAEIRFRLGRYYGARQDLAAAGEVPGAAVPPRAPPRALRIDGRAGAGAWSREQWPGRLGELRDQIEAALAEKNLGEAQRLIAEAQRLYPGSAFGPFLAGVFQLAQGDADAAERSFSEALLAAPRFPTVVAALGRAWSRKGGAAAAGARLMQLAERDPQLATARYLAARAYVEAGDPGKAEGALRRGLQLQPDSPVPYRQLTDYEFGLERGPEALEICQQGVDLFPEDVALRMMLGQVHVALGRTDDAIRVFEELARRRPDLDVVQYRLATLLADAPQSRQRFLEIVRRLQEDLPTDPLQMDALGWLVLRAGDLPRARSLLEAAVSGAPDQPGPRFHLATLYARQGEASKAHQQLEVALDSPRPFAERLEAMRLLRESGNAGKRP